MNDGTGLFRLGNPLWRDDCTVREDVGETNQTMTVAVPSMNPNVAERLRRVALLLAVTVIVLSLLIFVRGIPARVIELVASFALGAAATLIWVSYHWHTSHR